MASVTLEQVGKRFDAASVLEELTFDVQDGEFFVVLGPSRSGKSTMLRLIAGLETVSTGSIRFDDRDVTSLRPGDRDIGMFFQNFALYPNKTGFGNIAASLQARGVPAEQIRARVAEVAELLDVTHLLDRTPATYSGGEQQRVAIGRTIARRAGVYLFDEPLSNLDALVRLRLRTEFRRLQRDLGITTLYVTPDQHEALALADRVMILRGGRIAQIGTPTGVYSRPEDAWVARFVGSPRMNVLTGSLQRGEEGALIFANGSDERIVVHGAGDRDWPLDRPVGLGIRAEAMVLSGAGGGGTRVETIESLGRRKLVHLAFGGEDCQVLLDAHAPAAEGDTVRPACAAADVHLFAADGGERLTYTR